MMQVVSDTDRKAGLRAWHASWDKRVGVLKKSKLPWDRLRFIAANMIINAPWIFNLLHHEYRIGIRNTADLVQRSRNLVRLMPCRDQGDEYHLAYNAAAGVLWRQRRPDILGYPFERCISMCGAKDADDLWAYLMTFDDLALEISTKALILSGS